MLLLDVSTDMRRGEILGLTWKDIDLERKQAMVRRSLQPDGTLSEPKTAPSRREVPLVESAFDALRQQKARQNALRDTYRDSGFLFADATGGVWVPNGISTLYRSILKRAEISKFSVS